MFSLIDEETACISELGQRLKSLRKSQGQSQIAFAARIGITPPTYRRMEKGDPATPLAYWVRAARLLNRLDEFEELLRPSVFESL